MVERVVARLRSGLGEGGMVLVLVLVLVLPGPEAVVVVGLELELELELELAVGFGLLGDRALSGDEKRKRFRVFLFWSSSESSSSMMARLRRFAGGAIADDFGIYRGVALVTSHWEMCGLKCRLCVSQWDRFGRVVVVVVEQSVVDGSQWIQCSRQPRRAAESACRLASSAVFDRGSNNFLTYIINPNPDPILGHNLTTYTLLHEAHSLVKLVGGRGNGFCYTVSSEQ
jgi:hypothetical protein